MNGCARPLPFSQPVSSEIERRNNTYESPLFIHLQICTDDDLLIEGAGMSELDFKDNQATMLDHVTTKVATPTLLWQEQEPTQSVELLKKSKSKSVVWTLLGFNP